MSLIELFLVAVSLSMDAFAASVCKGLSVKKLDFKKIFTVAFYFGFFQALMPFLGFVLVSRFSKAIEIYDHWIAFILLLLIGLNMIKESLDKNEEYCNPNNYDSSFKFKNMLPIAIATSIDALAVGVSFVAFINIKIIPTVLLIGIVTFIFSAVGIKIGNVFGAKFKSKAEFAGGIILIIIGSKLLLEHLGILTL